MPVTPEYVWSQTDEEVVIEVDIKGITRMKMDVFATDAMVKVVAHPYVLIVDLLEDVDADSSTAYTRPGHVTFRLRKVCASLATTICRCVGFRRCERGEPMRSTLTCVPGFNMHAEGS